VFNVTSPYCVFTGALIIYGLLAAAFWTLWFPHIPDFFYHIKDFFFSCSIAGQLYLTVALGMSRVKVNKYMYWMWIISFGTPAIAVIIGLAGNGFGYNFEAGFGICFFTPYDGNWWFMGILTFPSLIIAFICVVLMSVTVYNVVDVLAGKEIETNDDSSDASDSTKEKKSADKKVRKNWKKMLSYNQRSLLFIFIFCFCNSLANGFLVDIMLVLYDDVEVELTKYFQCILGTTIPSGLSQKDFEAYPITQCGTVDEKALIWGKMYYMTFWVEVFVFIQCLFLNS